MTETNYSLGTIKSLEYMKHVRQYPGMYIGSVTQAGLKHCVKEMVSNAIDEYLNGAGDTIIIKLNTKEHSVFVKDNARGIPHGEHLPGISALQACYGIQNTGGKYINASGEGGYNTSGGEHGVGGKAVNALSSKMIVTTAREGIKETVEFSKGDFISHKEEKSDEQGVSVLFYPDSEIFDTIEFNINDIREMIREFSYLCSGLTFIYEVDGKQEKFYSKEGLIDYLNYLKGNKELLFKPIYLQGKEGNFQVEAIIGYTSNFSGAYRLYTNNIPQEKGEHHTGFKSAWTSSLNKFAREKGWLKDKDENLTGSDYEEGQLLILNFKMIDPIFKGQAKEELSSKEGRTYVQKLITEELKYYFIAYEKDIKTIVNKALNARKAREAARKARDAARETKPKKESGLKAKMALSNKFIDCANKNPKERNLLLVEGLSAGSAAVEARNPKTDCIYMLRGKIISPLKTSIDKILANQEMNDIIKIIGAGFDKNFDISKCNFNKVVITSDQDADGESIELLLITFFYTYMKPLVEAGMLYRAVTPLYIIRQKDKEYYCYSDKELEEWKLAHRGNYDLLRAKGLGELNPVDLRKVCFEAEHYKRITISDASKTTELLETLMGSNTELRKQYVYDNATELGFNFD